MCLHAGFRLRRELGGRNSLAAWEHAAAVRESGSVVWFVLCFLLIFIIVVTVPFVCCFVKLPLSQSMTFCLFLSILLRTRRGKGRPHGAFVACSSQTITDDLEKLSDTTKKACLLFFLQIFLVSLIVPNQQFCFHIHFLSCPLYFLVVVAGLD